MSVVKLFANLRKLAGTKELSITGATFAAVVGELARRNPPVGEIILQNGELAAYIVLTVNGHNIIELATPIRKQDIVAIFPPIAVVDLTPLLEGEGNKGETMAGWTEKVLDIDLDT